MRSRVLCAAVAILCGTICAATSVPASAAADKDCGDFASQRAAQIFYLQHGGPQNDPHRLDDDNDGEACESNPAPYYFGSTLPGGGSSTPSITKVRTAVALSVKPGRAIAGESVRLRAAIRPQTTRTVSFQRRVQGRWVTVRRESTNGSGVSEHVVRTPSASTSYRVQVAAKRSGRKRYSSATSSQRVLDVLRQQVRLTLSRTSVYRTDRVTALAAATPIRQGRTLQLQARTARGWSVVDTARQNAKGRAAFLVPTGALGEVAYRARVVRYRGAVPASSAASTLTVVPRPDTTPPPVPTGLRAEAGDGELALTWTPVAATDLSHYELFARTSPFGTWARVWTGSTANARLTGLTNAQSYEVAVVSVDHTGNSSALSAAVLATPTAPTDVTAPATPADVLAGAGDTAVTLSWSAVSDPDLSHYVVYSRPTGESTWSASPPTTDVAATVTGLTNGVPYDFAVSAVDTTGNESELSTVATATPQAPPPGP